MTLADLYIVGFVATALTVMVREGWPLLGNPRANPVVVLVVVFGCALMWPFWVREVVAEALVA